ncbi:MAG TPA: ABC transporter permease [Chitinophagales bacterium]|nr:ABC transporter permease [Chitinophagales bacterium]HMZ88642.1 ABC transporter permease [Chitinophagales bacterium]HNE44703.1 ABC transporter permease [Chitinophagales bacterium]HNF70333.1 ABC transporter permease [Chitinophagales bacterium]HNI53283.1 ABC transporter permease [Chitinophagales bacterium]
MLGIFFKTIAETMGLVFQELRNNKLRTSLSLLGVSIGIFCIIAVLSAVDSLKRNMESGLNKLGTDMIYITRWPWQFSNEEYTWWEYVKRPTMKYDEFQQLSDKLTLAKAVAIETWLSPQEVKFMDHTLQNASISGVTSQYDEVYTMNFMSGRYFTDGESVGGSEVAILGYEVAQELFPGGLQPVGKYFWVRANGSQFKLRVIGVLEKEGESIIDISNDNSIIIPFNYIRRIVDMNSPMIDPMIEVRPKEGVTADEIKDEIYPIMRNIRNLRPAEQNDFAVNEITLAADALDNLFAALNMVGMIIGGFSILVGGFGIANIMFVSVKERTNVIGIKKSLGAKNYLILTEFLIEAIVLSLIGCLFGLLLVWVLMLVAENLSDFGFILSWTNIAIGAIISISLGVVAGIVPAITASRMNPVEAIRSR